MRLKVVQAFNTPKDARTITQVHAFIFDVRLTDMKSQLNSPESQLRSLTELIFNSTVSHEISKTNFTRRTNFTHVRLRSK